MYKFHTVFIVWPLLPFHHMIIASFWLAWFIDKKNFSCLFLFILIYILKKKKIPLPFSQPPEKNDPLHGAILRWRNAANKKEKKKKML